MGEGIETTELSAHEVTRPEGKLRSTFGVWSLSAMAVVLPGYAFTLPHEVLPTPNIHLVVLGHLLPAPW